MSQSDYNIANADGATVRADINSQFDAIGSQNSGSTAPPVTFPYMRWFDTANQQLKERNGANTAWRTVAEVIDGELAPYSAGESVETRFVRTGGYLAWESKAIGEEIWLDDSNPAVDVPPTDNPNFRYIKLTAGENGSGGYNEGVLINENVSGSAPLIEATAEINLPDSPFHGQVVRLLNTERRFVRAGEAGVAQDDQMQRITGYFFASQMYSVFQSSEGALFNDESRPTTSATSQSSGSARGISFDSALSPDARTSETTDGETRPRNIGRTVYMRIM